MKKRYFLQICGYFLFALLIFLFLFLHNFPYSTLEERMETCVRDKFEQRIDISGLSYSFPLGLYIQRIKILPDRKQLRKAAHLSECHLDLHLFPLFLARANTSFSLRLLQGSVHGSLNMDSLLNPQKYHLNMDWQDIRFRDNPFAYNRNRIKSIQGSSSGRLNLNGDLQKILPASGEGEIQIREVILDLSVPPLAGHSFRDFRGNCNWKLQERQLHIGGCRLQGKGLQGKSTGKVHLNRRIGRSRLDLNGRINFTESDPRIYSLTQRYLNTSKLDFRLKGSLNNPTYSLNY